MLPTPSVINRNAAPDSSSPVEIKEDVVAGASRMLEHEVPVEQDRFHFREEGIVSIDMAPAGLHHGYFRLGEVMNCALKKVRWRHKVGIKNRDELAGCRLQAFM